MLWIATPGIPSITKGSYLEAMRDNISMGLNAIEVEFVHGVRMRPEYAEQMAEEKPKNFMITAHAPYYINLCNPEKREASIQRIERTLERTEQMKGFSIAVHAGYYGKLTREQAYQLVDDAVSEIEDWMKENGIRVWLGLETTGKHSQFGTLDELVKMMKAHKRMHPVVDFAHIYARQGGVIDFDAVLDKVRKIKILHAHFSGIEYTDKGEKNHLPISSKRPDPQALLKALKKAGRDAVITCESPMVEKDAVLLMNMARKAGLEIAEV